MIRGFYTAASAAAANEQRLGILSNNIANIQTIGYKQDRGAARGFYEQLVSRMEPSVDPNSGQQVGVLETGSGIGAPVIDFASGALQQTGRPLDVALSGPGFLAVQTPAGEQYTRAGSLQVDTNGRLVQQGGNVVLGVNGPIVVSQAGAPVGEVTIDRAGRVFADGQQVGQLRIVEVPANALRKVGVNSFEATTPGAVQNAQQTTVASGVLEEANVDVGQTSVEMMEVIRSYGAVQEMLRLQDQVLGQTVGEVGRVSQ